MAATAEEIKEIVNEQIKDACIAGGMIYTMIKTTQVERNRKIEKKVSKAC